MSSRKKTARPRKSKFPVITLKSLGIGDDVRIEWVDAVSKGGWSDNTEARLPLHNIISSGFVIAKEKDRLTLAGCVDINTGNVARVHSIPTGGIKGVQLIEKSCISPGFYAISDVEAASIKKSKGK